MLKMLMAPKVTYRSNLLVREELEDELGTVEEAISIDSKGLIKYLGSYWKAIANEAIPVGTKVKVIGMEGLTLVVSPI